MLKTLWIMRHGLAESEFSSDFSRALSAVGRQEAEDVGRQIQQSMQFVPDLMLVSPFQRTQQTAQIVHQALAMSQPFVTDEMLVHYADHQLLGDYLQALDREHLIIISHMPLVANLCNYLLSPSGLCSSAAIYGFKTAQAVQLIFNDSGEAKLGQVLTPRQCV